jgi:hypothetical protein
MALFDNVHVIISDFDKKNTPQRLSIFALQGCAVNLYTTRARDFFFGNFQLSCGFLAGPSDGAKDNKSTNGSLSLRHGPATRSPAPVCVMLRR